MTTKEFYQQSLKGRGHLMSLPRRIHYFISRPFYRKLQSLIEAQGRSISKYSTRYDAKFEKLSQKLDNHTKNLAIQKDKVRDVIGEYQARHMDFDAILHRLGFIEEQLRQSDSRINEADSRINEVANSVRLAAKLTPRREPTKRIMIQYAVGTEHEHLLSLTRDIHTRYCLRHGIDYRIDNTPASGGRSAHWRKVELLIEAMAEGYDQIAWLDTDCVIVDPWIDLFSVSGFGIAVCECFDSPEVERHLNTGFILASQSAAVMEFLKVWNAMPTGGKWEDQSGFIELMSGRPHRDLLTILPNRFNCVAKHAEARDPVIRAFHGDPDRFVKQQALVASLA